MFYVLTWNMCAEFKLETMSTDRNNQRKNVINLISFEWDHIINIYSTSPFLLDYSTNQKKLNSEHLTECILLLFHMHSCSRSLSALYLFQHTMDKKMQRGCLLNAWKKKQKSYNMICCHFLIATRPDKNWTNDVSGFIWDYCQVFQTVPVRILNIVGWHGEHWTGGNSSSDQGWPQERYCTKTTSLQEDATKMTV